MNVQKVTTTENINLNPSTESKSISQQPKVDLNDPVDQVEFSTKQETKKSSVPKKLGTAFTSMLYPGLGQLVNGDTKSAAKHFFGSIGTDIVAGVGVGIALAAATPVGAAIALAGTIGHAAIAIHSIVDAYKNA